MYTGCSSFKVTIPLIKLYTFTRVSFYTSTVLYLKKGQVHLRDYFVCIYK